MRWMAVPLSLFAAWMLLFWSLEPSVLVAGVVLAVGLGLPLARLYPAGVGKALDPRRWLWFALYLPYFLYYCIRANLDVAVRVIHPDLPIRPGIVKVRTSLASETARTFLANSITLTPGTLTVEMDGADLYVHWINIDTEDAAARTAKICHRFERLLRRVFE